MRVYEAESSGICKPRGKKKCKKGLGDRVISGESDWSWVWDKLVDC